MLLAALVACIACLALTWTLVRVAPRAQRRNRRPSHRPALAPAVPRLGGLAVFGAVAAAVFAWVMLNPGSDVLHGLNGIIAGATVLFFTGLVDDLIDLSPAIKLLSQFAAAGLAVGSGILVSTASFGQAGSISLGLLAVPMTLFWIVGVTNGFNFVDGLDGLAGGVGAVTLTGVAIVASLLGHPTVAMLALVTTCALVGFLRFNIAPARIYLGDSGSQFVGFLLATLSLLGSSTNRGTLVLVPIAAAVLPLSDMLLAIARRVLRGIPVWIGDHRHIHHRVVSLGYTERQGAMLLAGSAGVVMMLGMFGALVAGAVVPSTLALGVLGALAASVFALRQLDYYEITAVISGIASGRNDLAQAIRDEIHARDHALEIHHARWFDEVQSVLDRMAEAVGLERIELEEPSARPGRTRSRSALMRASVQLPVSSMGEEEGWSLRIWHGGRDVARALAAAQVARIVVPELIAWFDRAEASIASGDAVPISAYSRRSRPMAVPAVAAAEA
ncbi:MAG: glycosyl transferase group 4 family protein [Gemmatimonadetes bacterium]|nr:glycosyl transferase group 4 family protein [Gemmatimonadota bacterium]